MKEFKITNTFGLGKARHDHLVFLDYDNGIGYCTIDGSKNKKHTHKVIYLAPQEEQVDDFGNIIQEARQEGWYIMPAEDGHTHDKLNDYVGTYSAIPEESEEEIIRWFIELYKEAVEIEADNKKKAEESEKFYLGEQWNKTDKDFLESRDRACLTINEIEKNIDTLMGLISENRMDIYFAPQEASDQKRCDLYNHLTKFILKRGKFTKEEAKAALQMLVRGRGWLAPVVTAEDDLQGEIKVLYFDDEDIYPGPHEDELLDDCEYIFKSKMYSLERLKGLFPEKAIELSSKLMEFQGLIPALDEIKTRSIESFTSNQWAMSENRMPVTAGGMPVHINGHKVIDIARKSFRLLECRRKYFLKGKVAVYQTDDFIKNISDWSPSDIARLELMADENMLPVFDIIEKPVKKIRITKVAGGILLSDEKFADLPREDFYIVPLYAKKLRDRYWGKVESVKDPQREVNKRHSQAVDIGNKMCAYGYWYDHMTFDDPKLETQFKQLITTPGFALKVGNINNRPIKEEGVNFPTQIVQLMELGSRKIIELMNITVEPLGQNQSFIHLMQQYKSKITSNQFIFDNLKYAKEKIGELIASLIPRYYDGERALRILGNNQEVGLDGQPIANFTAEEIDEMLKVDDADRFDVEVIEVNPSSTTRMMEFALLQELAKVGAPISPSMLINAADIPVGRKNEVLAESQAQSEQAMQQAQSTGDMEIEKSLVGKGIIPPSVQQRFGIDAHGNATGAQAGESLPQRASPVQMQDSVGGVLPDSGTFSKPVKEKKVWKEFDPELQKEVIRIQEL